jgi:signal peptidase I
MPFWLFAVMWAILSYLIILTIASITGLGGVKNNADISVPTESIEPENISMKSLSSSTQSLLLNKKKSSSSSDMKPGYYILDTNETMKRGIPKYIYLLNFWFV